MSFREVAEPDQLRSEPKSEEEVRLSAWMTLAQKGESEPYRKLLAELNTMLGKYAARALKRASPQMDSSAVQDVVQEILLAIHAKRHTYDPTQRFLPWVFGIARHKIVDWQRKHFSELRRLNLDFEIETAVDTTGETPSEDIHGLLSKLNPKQREVIELTKLKGLTVSETAEKTGLSKANVKVLTYRAMAALKKLIGGPHE